jgi:hypothetical protein
MGRTGYVGPCARQRLKTGDEGERTNSGDEGERTNSGDEGERD